MKSRAGKADFGMYDDRNSLGMVRSGTKGGTKNSGVYKNKKTDFDTLDTFMSI